MSELLSLLFIFILWFLTKTKTIMFKMAITDGINTTMEFVIEKN